MQVEIFPARTRHAPGSPGRERREETSKDVCRPVERSVHSHRGKKLGCISPEPEIVRRPGRQPLRKARRSPPTGQICANSDTSRCKRKSGILEWPDLNDAEQFLRLLVQKNFELFEVFGLGPSPRVSGT